MTYGPEEERYQREVKSNIKALTWEESWHIQKARACV
jgi:hypothetical protein